MKMMATWVGADEGWPLSPSHEAAVGGWVMVACVDQDNMFFFFFA